jgi:hypothetical protein
VPGLIVKAAIRFIRGSVRRRAGFDIYDLKPIDECPRAFIPAMFCHGEQDDFIAPSHSQRLHGAYAGDKNLVMCGGGHNSRRPRFLVDSATIFLKTALRVPDALAVPGDDAGAVSAATAALLGADRVHEGMSPGSSQRAAQVDADAALERAIALSLADARAAAARDVEERAESSGGGRRMSGPGESTETLLAADSTPPRLPAETLPQGSVLVDAILDAGLVEAHFDGSAGASRAEDAAARAAADERRAAFGLPPRAPDSAAVEDAVLSRALALSREGTEEVA